MDFTNLAPHQLALLAGFATVTSAIIAAVAAFTTAIINGRSARKLDRQRAWREFRLQQSSELIAYINQLRRDLNDWACRISDTPLKEPPKSLRRFQAFNQSDAGLNSAFVIYEETWAEYMTFYPTANPRQQEVLARHLVSAANEVLRELERSLFFDRPPDVFRYLSLRFKYLFFRPYFAMFRKWRRFVAEKRQEAFLAAGVDKSSDIHNSTPS